MPPGVVYPDHYRILAIFKGKSGLPEDVFVNTWHVRNDALAGSRAGTARDIAARVHDFYFEAINGTRLSSFMPASVIDSVEYRGYDLGQQEPREAFISTPADMDRAAVFGGGDALPLEVAACLSFKTAVIPPKAGTVGKRGRGRLFIGPLTTQAMTPSAGSGYPAVHEVLRTAAVNSFQRFANLNFLTPVVLSPTYQQTDRINGVWMDDAFDTQQRRGQEPKVRTALPI